MPNTPLPLDPLRFPLSGSHLIEASAGTGKTFTIALLYVRLVLGHLHAHAFQGGALTPPEILVVTFTDAATKELRERIRARLTQAACAFRNTSAETPPDDPLLVHLRNDYPPTDWPRCARRLELAAEWMDEAAISTIHGWCARMLREHAFDCQTPFMQHVQNDSRTQLSECVRDYWRRFVIPLDLEQARQYARHWTSPDSLEARLRALLPHVTRLAHAAPPAQALAEHQARQRDRLAPYKSQWRIWADALLAHIDQALQDKQLDGKKLQRRWYAPWFQALREWAESDAPELDLGTGWQRLTPQGMREACRSGTLPEHPAFASIPALHSELNTQPSAEVDLLLHASHWVAKAFAQAQKQRACIGFDDFIKDMHRALHGSNGTQLIEKIRRQFPIALVDEFQDTDPLQYQIFDRVYEIAGNRSDLGLILIGDPKQAIYAFRGADIHTYLAARVAVGERCYTLTTNYRASQAMVRASNLCFSVQEKIEHGPGAFLFRKGAVNPVPFYPVTTPGRAETFHLNAAPAPALHCIVLDSESPCSRQHYLEQMAAHCAETLQDWLHQATQRRAFFATTNDTQQPLLPGDCAILVNNGNEARSIRQALAAHGIRSVFLSDKDTVFASEQAQEIRHWLAACAAPEDERALRLALATPTLGRSTIELDALNHDEIFWENCIEQFKGYHDLWQRHGVLPLIHRILHDFSCPARLLARAVDTQGQSGERALTDLLHLAELLQHAAATQEGEHSLIRFLDEHIADPGEESESKKLRLESDADLVQVVTIHKSKGLEYPLVFLPFICAHRMVKASDRPLFWHDESGTLQVSLNPDSTALLHAEEERLGEDIRKLYVALTRARHLTWLGIAPLESFSSCALAHVLNLRETSTADLLPALRTFAEQDPALSVSSLPTSRAPATPLLRTAPLSGPAGRARPALRTRRQAWWVGSYSGLPLEHRAVASAQEDSPAAEQLVEEQTLTSAPLTPPLLRSPIATHRLSMHAFPRGAEAGSFLHALLEWAAQRGLQNVLRDPAAVRDMLARRAQIRQWERWIEPLCDWLHTLLQHPLPLDPDIPATHTVTLAALSTYKAEMEFCFEARHVDLAHIDALIQCHCFPGQPRPVLRADTLNGMLKGFIDLVFEYQGQYFVLDYKSNWLGEHDSAYTQDNLHTAILNHRYDLQYVLYLFALHRLLRTRLPDYDYDRHIGGALYLFLRGLNGPARGVHRARPSRALFEALDALFSGQHLPFGASA